jgi:hypothetical protein
MIRTWSPPDHQLCFIRMFLVSRLLSCGREHRFRVDRPLEEKLREREQMKGRSCGPASKNLEESSLLLIIYSLIINIFSNLLYTIYVMVVNKWLRITFDFLLIINNLFYYNICEAF